MSFSYTSCVGRVCLVTFQKHPRVLIDDNNAIRLIAAVGEVEAVGTETVSLLLYVVFPHRADTNDDQRSAEVDPPLELTLRSDAVLSLHVVDEDEDEDEDEDSEDEDEEASRDETA